MSAPEDILSSALLSLYALPPVSVAVPNDEHDGDDPDDDTAAPAPYTHPSGVSVLAPDPAPANWSLHASSLWIAALFLANHIHDVPLPAPAPAVLELGAATGLPGILLAKHTPSAHLTLSDFPDPRILRTLAANAARNALPPASVRVVGHAWGEPTAALGTFDLVLAADTLWDPAAHAPLCRTLARVLRRAPAARAVLVAGLHTGRWAVASFLRALPAAGLAVEHVRERSAAAEVGGAVDDAPPDRAWSAERAGEDESERRRWIVWIVVKWP